MARINNLASALGLEDDDVMPVNGEVTEATVAETSNDISETMNDIDAAGETASNLMDDSTTLDAVGDVVDESIDNGEGVSEQTAEVIEETVENILRRHGLHRSRAIRNMVSYPSNENFNSRAGRLNAARKLKVSIEGVWDTILRGIESLFKSIKDFFRKLGGHIGDFDDQYNQMFRQLKDEVTHSGGLGFKDLSSKQHARNTTATVNGHPLGNIPFFDQNNETITIIQVHDEMSRYSNSVKNGFNGIIKKIEDNDVVKQNFYNNANIDNDPNNQQAYHTNGGNSFSGATPPGSNITPQEKCAMLNNVSTLFNKDCLEITNGLFYQANQLQGGNASTQSAVSGKSKARWLDQVTDKTYDVYIECMDIGMKLTNQGIGPLIGKETNGFFTRLWEAVKRFFGGAKKAIETGANAMGSVDPSATTGSNSVSYKTQKQAMNDVANTYRSVLNTGLKLYQEAVRNMYNILSLVWKKQGSTGLKARQN